MFSANNTYFSKNAQRHSECSTVLCPGCHEVHNPLARSEQQANRQSMFPRELSSPLELGDCLFTGPWFAHRASSIETLATLNRVLGTETQPRAKYLDINDGKRSHHGNSIVNAGEYFTVEWHRMFKRVPTWPIRLMGPPCFCSHSVKKKTFWTCEQVWDRRFVEGFSTTLTRLQFDMEKICI